MVLDKQSDILSQIHTELLNGNYDKAESLKIEHQIRNEKFNYELEQSFAELVAKGSIARAIELGEKYVFSEEEIRKAATQQYWHHYKKKEYDKAAQWGKRYGISEQNVLRAAEKAFEIAIRKHEIEKAIKLKDEYDIQPESVKLITTQGFNSIFSRGEYLKAAKIGKEFDVSHKRTDQAAAMGFLEFCQQNDVAKAVEVVQEFNIISDEAIDSLDEVLQDKVITAFLSDIIQQLLKLHKFQMINEVLTKIKLLKTVYGLQKLNDLKGNILESIIASHNQALQDKKYSEAISLKESFNLLGTEIDNENMKQIINTAQSVYSDLVKKGNLTSAETIKKEYGLFKENVIDDSDNVAQETGVILISAALEKGNMKTVTETMKELNLKTNQVKEAAVDVIIKLIHKKEFEIASKILKKFDLYNDREIEKYAADAFDDAYHNGLYEQASTIGYTFRVNKELTKDAAYNIWKRYMLTDDHVKAKEIKRKFKLGKNKTEQIANQVYEELLRNNKSAVAAEIRKEYDLSKNIFSLFMEFFKKIF